MVYCFNSLYDGFVLLLQLTLRWFVQPRNGVTYENQLKCRVFSENAPLLRSICYWHSMRKDSRPFLCGKCSVDHVIITRFTVYVSTTCRIQNLCDSSAQRHSNYVTGKHKLAISTCQCMCVKFSHIICVYIINHPHHRSPSI